MQRVLSLFGVRLCLLIALFLGVSVHAAIPESVAGYRLHLTYDVWLAARIPRVYVDVIDFDASGHYTVRYSYSQYTDRFNYPQYGSLSSGTYSYQKTEEGTATLTLTSESNQQRPYRLIFNDDLGGYTTTAYTFLLVPPKNEQRPLTAVSTRARVRPGDDTIVGFIVERGGDYLLRIGGPMLAQFGVKDVWATPRFYLCDKNGLAGALYIQNKEGTVPIAVPTWGADAYYKETNTKAALASGAFPFSDGSNDISFVVYLPPGAYTMVANTADNDPGGNALIEVYAIP